MKLSEIKEIGYYCQVGDTERSNIYEVIKNTDKEWLKEDPKATLLIDTWIYEYKDENDRSVYFADGNLLSVYLHTSIIDVVKIENINYKVFGEYGQYLIEDKPTYKEQLRTAQARVKELEEKLKIAKEALQYYADGEDIGEAKLQCSDAWRYIVDDNHTDIAKQALQKMKEVK